MKGDPIGTVRPVGKRRVGRTANALVSKTSGRNPLQVRILYPPLSDGVKNRGSKEPRELKSHPLRLRSPKRRATADTVRP